MRDEYGNGGGGGGKPGVSGDIGSCHRYDNRCGGVGGTKGQYGCVLSLSPQP